MYLDHDIQRKCEHVVLDNLNNSASHNMILLFPGAGLETKVWTCISNK